MQFLIMILHFYDSHSKAIQNWIPYTFVCVTFSKIDLIYNKPKDVLLFVMLSIYTLALFNFCKNRIYFISSKEQNTCNLSATNVNIDGCFDTTHGLNCCYV